MIEKISLDELKKLSRDEVEALTSRLWGLLAGKGVDVAEDYIRDKFLDVIEDIHIDKATVNKYSRKFRKWWKGLF